LKGPDLYKICEWIPKAGHNTGLLFLRVPWKEGLAFEWDLLLLIPSLSLLYMQQCMSLF